MNIVHEINKLKQQYCNLLKGWGLLIVKIGDNAPNKKLFNTLQVQNNGDMYIIDRVGEMQKIGIFGEGEGGSGSGYVPIPPIEVTIGSAEGNTLGIVAGTTITLDNFVNKDVEIFIGNVNLYMTEKPDPIPYFIKTYESDTAALHNIELVDGDTIKIKFL